jgi:hypothetical protein
MSEQPLEQWEQHLLQTARAFPYPATPDIARKVTHELEARGRRPTARRSWQRLAWTAAILVVLLAGLLAVPPVRAQILEFLQVGIIRIFLVQPTPTATATPAATPAQPAAGPGTAPLPLRTPQPTATPRPSPTPLSSVLDLQGEITLEEASSRTEFPILLPAYPEDLGEPDRVYLQELDGQVLVLVWLEPGRPDEVRLSLHTYVGKNNVTGEKSGPRFLRETTVNGEYAVWAEGPYVLKLRNGNYDYLRMIAGRVLIWTNGEITYRLETDLTLEEAVRIAESLEPLAPSTPAAP